jgi:GntR family transcriptional regulator, transcriptional repressor for pyruvate dehydrogenase complex
VLPSPGSGHDLTEAVLRPARGYHAFEACVEQLATTIRLGVYPTGSTLPSERELAERLHVSRSTLREAMAALREAGLVETRRGRGGGTVVTLKPKTPSARAAARIPEARRRDWLDSLVFRRVVEPGAAQQAARIDLDAEAVAQLEEAHAAVAEARRPAEHRQADSRFHLTIAALTGSPRILEAVTAVQSTLHEMLLAIPVLDANIAHSDRQHAALVRNILRGHHERARTVMEEHCDDTAALLRGLLG